LTVYISDRLPNGFDFFHHFKEDIVDTTRAKEKFTDCRMTALFIQLVAVAF
jgi:hypothetical protein